MFKCSGSMCFCLSLFNPFGCKIETIRQQNKFQRDEIILSHRSLMQHMSTGPVSENPAPVSKTTTKNQKSILYNLMSSLAIQNVRRCLVSECLFWFLKLHSSLRGAEIEQRSRSLGKFQLTPNNSSPHSSMDFFGLFLSFYTMLCIVLY